MNLETLIRRYEGLRRELIEARAAGMRQVQRLERLAEELLATQRAIADLQSGDEQTSETMPPFSLTR